MRKKQLVSRLTSGPDFHPHVLHERTDLNSSSFEPNSDSSIPVVFQRDANGRTTLLDGTPVIEPVSVEARSSTKQKTGHCPQVSRLTNPGVLDVVKCTVCSCKLYLTSSTLKTHPILKVIQCKRCAKFYIHQRFLQDSSGKDENCRWCADGGDLICCDFCSNAFCKRCIKRNLGRGLLHEIESLEDTDLWKCFICDPSPIRHLQEQHSEIIAELEKVRIIERRRSEIRQESSKSRSSSLLKGSDHVPVKVPETECKSAVAVTQASASSFEQPDTLQAISGLLSTLGQPSNTQADFPTDSSVLTNFLQLIGRSLYAPLNSHIENQLPNSVIPASMEYGNSATTVTNPSIGHMVSTDNPALGKMASTEASIDSSQKVPVDFSVVLNQIAGVNANNIRAALKATRRCIDTFSSDLRRLENKMAQSSSSKEVASVVRSFQSVYRFHLIARLSNLTARMREEAPFAINGGFPQLGSVRNPIPDGQPLYNSPKPNPVTIDLTCDSPRKSLSARCSNTSMVDSNSNELQRPPFITSSSVESPYSMDQPNLNVDFHTAVGDISVDLCSSEYNKVDVPCPSKRRRVESTVEGDQVNKNDELVLSEAICSPLDGSRQRDVTHAVEPNRTQAPLAHTVVSPQKAVSESVPAQFDDTWQISEHANFTESNSPMNLLGSHTEEAELKNGKNVLSPVSVNCDPTLNRIAVQESSVFLEDIRPQLGDKSFVDLKFSSQDAVVENSDSPYGDLIAADSSDTSDTGLSTKESVSERHCEKLGHSVKSKSSVVRDISRRVQSSAKTSSDSSDTELSLKVSTWERLCGKLDKPAKSKSLKPSSGDLTKSKNESGKTRKSQSQRNHKTCPDLDADEWSIEDAENNPDNEGTVGSKEQLRSALLSEADLEYSANMRYRDQLLRNSSDESDGEPVLSKTPHAKRRSSSSQESEVSTDESTKKVKHPKYTGPLQSLMRPLPSLDQDADQPTVDGTKGTDRTVRIAPPVHSKIGSRKSSTDVDKDVPPALRSDDTSDSSVVSRSVESDDSPLQARKSQKITKVRKVANQLDDLTDSGESASSVTKSRNKTSTRPDTSANSSETDESESTRPKIASNRVSKPRRRRKLQQKHSSSDSENANVEKKEAANSESDSDEPERKGRRHIRKIYTQSNLSQTTKTAEAEERDRRRRISERQKIYNDCVLQVGDGKDMVTKKLVLEKQSDSCDTSIEVHPEILKHLKPHQVDAVRFLWNCVIESVDRQRKSPNTQSSGAVLAHCMGLGKTLSVIAFVHCLFAHSELLGIRRCLVLCPVNTLMNWKHEWEMWLPEDDPVDVFELASRTDFKHRVDVIKNWSRKGGVMLLGYDMYRNFVNTRGRKMRNKNAKDIIQEALVNPGPDVVICDEGHVLKNDKSGLSKAISQVRTMKRIVLTGTPLQNNLTEYHAMVSFVKPNLLGTAKEFCNRFVNPIKNGQHSNSTERDVSVMKKRAHILYKTLDGCIQRMDYTALTKYLPARHEFVVMCRLTEIQCELYRSYLQVRSDRVINISSSKGDDTGAERRKNLFFDQQTLYRILTHPFLLRSHETREARRMLLEDDDDLTDSTDESDVTVNEDESSVTASSSSSESSTVKPAPAARVPRTRSRRTDSTDGIVCLDDDETGPPKPLNTGIGEADQTAKWWYKLYKEELDWDLEAGCKLEVLFRLLKKSMDIGDKVLVFSQSLLSLDLLERFLGELHRQWLISQGEAVNDPSEVENSIRPDLSAYFSDVGINTWVRGHDYERLDGSMSAVVRKELQTRFNRQSNTRLRLFVISTRAGGLGINLVSANRLILFDASWNPSNDVQSIFRSYRFGQTKPVYIYRLIAQGTMEEKIYDRQVTKQSLSLRVIDERQIDRHFTNADLQALYSFDPDVWDAEKADSRPTPKLPKDRLLADMLSEFPNLITNYHEHDSLLEHREDEGLTELERQEAWREYEEEKTLGISLAQHQRLLQHQEIMAQAQQSQAWRNPRPQQMPPFQPNQVPTWMNYKPLPSYPPRFPYPTGPGSNTFRTPGMSPLLSAEAGAPSFPYSTTSRFPGGPFPYPQLFEKYRSHILKTKPSLAADPVQLEKIVLSQMMDLMTREVRTRGPYPQPLMPMPMPMVNQPRPPT